MSDISTNAERGLFIVFEGIDLSGKSTQARLLREWFVRHKREAIITQEPTTGGLYGRHLRLALQGMLRTIQDEEDKLSEEIVRAQLFAIDRFIHLKNEIEPHLKDGVHVICDRYYLSSLVYQSVELEQLGYKSIAGVDPLERVKQLNADTLYAVTQPDIIIMIDIPVEAWIQRRVERTGKNGKVAEIYEKAEMREKYRRRYEEAMRLFDEDEILGQKRIRVELVRYEDNFRTRSEVFRRVLELVRQCQLPGPAIYALPLWQNHLA